MNDVEIDQIDADEDDVISCVACRQVIWAPNLERPGCLHTLLLTHAEGDEPFRCSPALFEGAVKIAGREGLEDADDLLLELRAEDGWDAPAEWILENEESLSRAADALLAGKPMTQVHISGHDDHTLWQSAGIVVAASDDEPSEGEDELSADLDDD